MNNWGKVKLGDVANVKLSNVDKKTNENEREIRLCNYTDVYKNAFINADKAKYFMIASCNENEYEKFILRKGQVAITKDSETPNDIGISTYISADFDDVVLGYHLSLITPNTKKLDGRFLNYWLNTKQSKRYFENNAGGSGQRCTLPLDIIKSIPLLLPNLTTQKHIASVLSALDDKIELNNKINAELEQMAKLLYDYWFVQFDFPVDNAFSPSGEMSKGQRGYKTSGGKMVYNTTLKRDIPEGWEVKKLGELGNFKNGVNYDPSKPGKIACPLINVRNISNSSFFIKNEDLDIIYLNESDVNKYSVHSGSIIIARSGIPGATRLISDFKKNTLYCGFAIHYDLEDLINRNIVFFYLKSIESLIQNGSGGTIMKNVNQGVLTELKIVLPPKNVLEAFNKFINPIFDNINQIQQQNQELSSLRDWLLPMLMNGQVKVAEVEKTLDVAAEREVNYGEK